MLKSIAMQKATEEIQTAASKLHEAKDCLGNIRRSALSDGGVRHIRTQIQKIEAISMELRDYAGCLDYDMGDDLTIAQNGEEE